MVKGETYSWWNSGTRWGASRLVTSQARILPTVMSLWPHMSLLPGDTPSVSRSQSWYSFCLFMQPPMCSPSYAWPPTFISNHPSSLATPTSNQVTAPTGGAEHGLLQVQLVTMTPGGSQRKGPVGAGRRCYREEWTLLSPLGKAGTGLRHMALSSVLRLQDEHLEGGWSQADSSPPPRRSAAS